MAKFFPTIENDATSTRVTGTDGGGKNPGEGQEVVVESNQDKFIFNQTAKGISIKHEKNVEELPKKIRINLFSQSDATLGGKNNDDLMDEFGDLKIKSSNCEVNKNKNIIFIENIQSGWEINISKFKAHFMGGCSIDEIKEGK